MTTNRRSFLGVLAAIPFVPFAKSEPLLPFATISAKVASGGTFSVVGAFEGPSDYIAKEITMGESGPTIRHIKRENGVVTEIEPARQLRDIDGITVERM